MRSIVIIRSGGFLHPRVQGAKIEVELPAVAGSQKIEERYPIVNQEIVNKSNSRLRNQCRKNDSQLVKML
jgi:hypothetical protein